LAAVGCTEFGRHPTTPAAPKSCARAVLVLMFTEG